MFKKSILTISALTLLILLSGASCNSTIYDNVDSSSTPSNGQVSGSSVDKDTLIGNAHYRGLQNAKVTIVEFSDFECPACASAHPVIKKVLEKYPNDVRLVYRHFPLSYHKNSTKATYAFEAAAKQGKTWEMFDLIFENSAKLNDGIYEEFARQIGLDIDQFNKDRASDEIKKIVDDDRDLGIKLNLKGTPTFYINGEEFNGQSTVNGFSKEIDKLLSQ